MLNITSHQANANGHYHEIPHLLGGCIKNKIKKIKTSVVGQDVEKLELVCIAGGNAKWYTGCRKYHDSPPKNYTITK